jgi:hypothetical protein
VARAKKKDRADTTASLGFEAKLWAAADALRNNMEAAALRGALLPNLISGVQVARVETLVEES